MDMIGLLIDPGVNRPDDGLTRHGGPVPPF